MQNIKTRSMCYHRYVFTG